MCVLQESCEDSEMWIYFVSGGGFVETGDCSKKEHSFSVLTQSKR